MSDLSPQVAGLPQGPSRDAFTNACTTDHTTDFVGKFGSPELLRIISAVLFRIQLVLSTSEEWFDPVASSVALLFMKRSAENVLSDYNYDYPKE